MKLATSEFRDQCITSGESWILATWDQDSPDSVRWPMPALIEPGYDSLHPGEESGGDRLRRWGRVIAGDRRKPRRRQV